MFSDIGIMLRCVSNDHTSTNNVLHYLKNGTAKFMFSNKRRLSYLPVVLLLKCLVNYTDEKIYADLSAGYEDDLYYKSCLQEMLHVLHKEDIHTHFDAKNYLGQIFRSRYEQLPAWTTNSQITDYILENSIMIHLDEHIEKYHMVVFMVKKLFQVAQGKAKCESADCVMMQELLLGGHLYQKIFKEFLETWMVNLRYALNKKLTVNSNQVKVSDVQTAGKYCGNLMKRMEHFLATGNLVSKTGLGLMQNSGLVIMAENINRMRYMSHFRAVHRGSYFVEMRTTEARQLLPDAWGFICPVHTPDGSPCGLLNHLTTDCISSPDVLHKTNMKDVISALVEVGMEPIDSNMLSNLENHFSVMVEGRIVGFINDQVIKKAERNLRAMKIDDKKIPKNTEIVLVPKKKCGQYPGLFLFLGSARMMRPVINLEFKKIEMIGTFEQVRMFLKIFYEIINVESLLGLS